MVRARPEMHPVDELRAVCRSEALKTPPHARPHGVRGEEDFVICCPCIAVRMLPWRGVFAQRACVEEL